MLEHHELTALDPNNPYVPFNTGCYSLNLEIPGGGTRRMIIYIPEGTQPSAAGVFLLPPSGVSAEKFLEKSNWKDIADGEETKEKLVLFLLESGKDGWNVEEEYGCADGDIAYLRAAFAAGSLRTIICVHESKYYMAGYGDGAAIAQMAAMDDPAHYAGVVCVDAPPVNPEYIGAAAADYAVDLMGYEDLEHLHGIRKGDIPLPVWIIDSHWTDETPEARHWLRANGIEEGWQFFDRETHTYVRTAETPYPLNQDKEAYRVWISRIPNASRDLGRRLNRRIWKDFLYRVRRWMADPGGSLRMTKDPVRDLGMEYHYEMVDGWMREWYTYVPQAVKAAPEKKVPLVFACHGYSCSGEIYMGNSGWYDVAEKYGFIVVFPTAILGKIMSTGHKEGGASPDNTPLPTWNTFGRREGRPYENNYFEYMLEKICASHAIDRQRVYVTGHSNGSMMTSWLALTKPELFAAAAPCSGILFMAGQEDCLGEPEIKNRKMTDIPVWMLGGEREPWLLDAVPTPDNRTGQSIYTWWDMNRMPGGKPADFDHSTVHAQRWHDWTWEKDGMPMIRFTGIDYFPHATMPEMSFRIWEEFFSKFHRAEDGRVVFEP